MRKPDVNRVEVDMVPLINIISLLLMFLIIVGNTRAICGGISMKLPPADAAVPQTSGGSKGQLVIQMDNNVDGKYEAVVNNKRYELGSEPNGRGGELFKFLDAQVGENERQGTPVKLRIPESCPMQDAGKLMYTLTELKLLKVQYAAEPAKK